MQEIARKRFQTKACIAGARTFLMLFNVIFWIAGFILLLFGLWMRVSIGKVFEIAPQFNFALPTMLIICGSLMMIVSVLACFSSSTDSPTLLYILSVIFFLIFGSIFALSITGYAYRDTLKEQLYKSLNHTLNQYGTGNIMDKDLDRIQIHFDCCGVDNFEDWLHSDWHQKHNLSFPDSCCKTLKHCDNKLVEQTHMVGCYPVIVNTFNENLSTLGLGTFFIALFQLCGVTLAVCLANHINKAKYEEMY
ncbi:tetraspanin-6 [Dermatophagoides farinae]|uniref:Tetraspanin n=1 Tax=Dermatophagoides farinae TaxID=6954 RepID=A0A922I5P7_DERFA|nr:tetraspanin-6-like [Dermatophagoides farinae]XP_046909410.1 tetraspanin-6-like [Dermatophagoides farinae]XP_046909411.1 tetraspanin-6-like [Dermatophagoides farinae]XP_046909412.1 tetraspanin-6-like [Dermatophagoides farinae]KAH7639006.1 tetraspanin-like protein 7 [Dermatophagoides farinae]KAH9522586.1 Tetraspanin-7 [Dermatophagoides farinae]